MVNVDKKLTDFEEFKNDAHIVMEAKKSVCVLLVADVLVNKAVYSRPLNIKI